MTKKKVLFMAHDLTSFFGNDYDILRKYFDVKVLLYKQEGFPKFLFRLFKGVLWADLTFSWFADVHAFVAVLFSKIFRKKSIVVVGGYEVAKVPEIEYGAMLNKRKALIVKFVLKHADKVLTVDESLKKDAIKNAKANEVNIQTVPTGYDPDFWKSAYKKEDLVLTVANVTDIIMVKLKGIETFIKAAKDLPNIKFVIIGCDYDNLIKYLKSIAPFNIEFVGFLPQNELVKWYQKAKVYCQLSIREGLPNALCEAMCCECVPVGTNVQGVTTAIGDTGFYVPYGDPKATAEAIKEALKSDKGKDARERIKRMFPMERREKELIQIIKEI
jgi:glycosyltransferase involved in cell wall biosynthesis